mgnify:CR=1 FL=1
MKSPCFIRIDKEILPKLYENNDWSKIGFATHGDSSTAFICGTGISTWAALDAKSCLTDQNVECTVVDFIKVKPLNLNDLSSLFKNAKWVVVIEESVSSGGLWELIGASLINKRISFFLKLNLGDSFILGSAKREWAWEKYGINGESVSKKIMKTLLELE